MGCKLRDGSPGTATPTAIYGGDVVDGDGPARCPAPTGNLRMDWRPDINIGECANLGGGPTVNYPRRGHAPGVPYALFRLHVKRAAVAGEAVAAEHGLQDVDVGGDVHGLRLIELIQLLAEAVH